MGDTVRVVDTHALREAITAAKAQIATHDKVMANLLLQSTREHAFAIEADIQRYQRDLVHALNAKLNTIDNARNDSGHLALALTSLTYEFERIGNPYIRRAADFGFQRVMADLKLRGYVGKVNGVVRAPESVIRTLIDENAAYLKTSLLPDLHSAIHQSDDGAAIATKFTSRIRLYGHYLWTTAEHSYLLGLRMYAASVSTSLRESGTASSGDHGHRGRPGQKGGSSKDMPQHAMLVRNIIATFKAATAKDLTYGTHWYEAAHAFAMGLSKKHGMTLEKAAGIIAAMSPHNSWARNMTNAEELAKTGKTTGLGMSLRKSQEILAGINPDIVLAGKKTNAFYHNILDPSDTEHVTIDRHAVALAIGPNSDYDIAKLDNKGHYAHFVEAYKEAAEKLGVSPSVVQGVTWSRYRSTLAKTPAKDDLAKYMRERAVRMREGGDGSGNFGHVGRPGNVGGSGSGGVHVAKVIDSGKQSIPMSGMTSLDYTAINPDKETRTSILSEVDANIDAIPTQPRTLTSVFFTDDMTYAGQPLTDTAGITFNSLNPYTGISNGSDVGFNTALINAHNFESAKSDPYTVADRATEIGQYRNLIVDHEMGHVLWNNLSYAQHVTFSKAYSAWKGDLKSTQLSEYGNSDSNEGFAEAYTLYVNKFPGPFQDLLDTYTDHHTLKESSSDRDQPIAYLCGFGHGPTYHVYSDHVETLREGGHGSGNYGHVGRQGLVGGSGKGMSPALIEQHFSKEFAWWGKADKESRLNKPAFQRFTEYWNASSDSPQAILCQSVLNELNGKSEDYGMGPQSKAVLTKMRDPSFTGWGDDLPPSQLVEAVCAHDDEVHGQKGEFGKPLYRGLGAEEWNAVASQPIGTEVSFRPLMSTTTDPSIATAYNAGHQLVFNHAQKSDVFTFFDNQNKEAVLHGGRWAVSKVEGSVAYLDRIGLSEAQKPKRNVLQITSQWHPLTGQTTDESVPTLLREGGAGSGNFGHVGRPGNVGGSGSGGTAEPVKPIDPPAPVAGAEEYSGPIAPWDMKADAPPRYPGDDSIFSPALKDANGEYALGRRLQGTQTGKDPQNQIVMYTFIPGSATPEQMSRLEGMIKADSDHAQLHPGEIAYNDDKGNLVKIPGNNYWIRGDLADLEHLHGTITPAVAKEFGDKSAWSIMMAPETPGGGKITTGEPTTHMRVVVPFEKGTPENTVGTPALNPGTRDAIMSVMAEDGRRVWQHADFNGMHIATNIDPKDQDSINARVHALGGVSEPEEQHHSVGATRFIPKDINIEDYPVRESMREGGAGSGDHDHAGRIGKRGGSSKGVGSISSATAKTKLLALRQDDGNTYTVHLQPTTADEKELVVNEIDKNLEIKGQVPKVDKLFFTNGLEDEFGATTSGFGGITLTASVNGKQKPIVAVGFDRSNIAAASQYGQQPFAAAIRMVNETGKIDNEARTMYVEKLVVDHEMGHVFAQANPEVYNRFEPLPETSASANTFSSYSTTSKGEAFAEAYASYLHNDKGLPVEYQRYFSSVFGDQRLREASADIKPSTATYICGFGISPTVHIIDGVRTEYPAMTKLKEAGTASSGDYGHSGRPGEVGGSGNGSPAISAAIKGLSKGGFSVSTEGKTPRKGFMVAGEIDEEQHVIGGNEDALRAELSKFQAKHADLLAKPERYMGGWIEKNTIYLDVSQRYKVGRKEALRIGRDGDQIAVWDLKGKDTLYTMSDHKRPSESTGTILESNRSTSDSDGIGFAIMPGDDSAIDKLVTAWKAKFDIK